MSYPSLDQNELLLVDDNASIIAMLQFALQHAGYDVRVAMSGTEAVQSVERFGLPALVLIDINLPGMNGFELARHLRQQSRVPIIMITAQSQAETVVAALSEFADDYLIKPFTSAELLARIERVLRRSVIEREWEWQTVDAHLRFKANDNLAELDGDVIELTPLESKLLKTLLAHKGRPASADQLLNKLWPFEAATTGQLRVTVSRLRKKLQRPPTNHNYIAVQRSIGYQLELNNVA
jgi:two-component system, OmpR family, alkaline phosphatase synthesis response regulator PhoP